MGGMKFRKLLIAWSVVWGLAAVLLIVFGVRSYRTDDRAEYGPLNTRGHRWLGMVFSSGTFYEGEFNVRVFTPVHRPPLLRKVPFFDIAGFRWAQDFGPLILNISVPMWFLVTLSAVSAAFPWIRWSNRFSLRTLLIATTLVGMALGLVIWMGRNNFPSAH
jgi:hypothetical protein